MGRKNLNTGTDMVFNSSSISLTNAELSLLNKGLNFSPTSKPNQDNFDKGLDAFERRLQIQYHFYIVDGYTDINYTKEQVLIKTKSKWYPKHCNAKISNFVDRIRDVIKDNNKQIHKHNLNAIEKAAINTLRNKNVTIRPCDKGAGICVMDDSTYINKCYALLDNLQDYSRIEEDPTMDICRRANELLDDMVYRGIIKNSESAYIKDFKPRCPRFYGNPKIHKNGHPMRPIVSQINGPANHLSKLANNILEPSEKKIPFLLQDTMALLQYIVDFDLPEGALLVTLDVASLYTRIEWDEGIRFVADWYEETTNTVPRIYLEKLLSFILRNNAFTFNNHLYHQRTGTAMGSSFSVRYANIYMHKKWKQLTDTYPLKPLFTARLIDDIIIIWQHGRTELEAFYTHINNADVNIKFEMTYSESEVHFLDTIVYRSETGKIKTKGYTKPTDRQAYLHFQSAHPRHVKKAIPYSQALRLRRITTDDADYHRSLNKLEKVFINRGYKPKFIRTEMNKTEKFKQKDLIQYKMKIPMERVPLVIPFTPGLDDLRNKIRTLWEKKVLSDPILANIFREPPILAFTKGKALSDLLTNSAFPPPWKSQTELNSTARMLCELSME